MKRMRWCSLMAVACMLMVLAPQTAWAAKKNITGLTVRVGTDTEAGGRLCDSDEIDKYEDSTEAKSEGTYAAVNSEKYYIHYAEWVSEEGDYMSIGQRPKMRLYLRLHDEEEYTFRSSYSSSAITVKGGTFVSARRSNGELEIVVRLNGIKGQFYAPTDATWRETSKGRAIWDTEWDDDHDDEYYKSISSGYYDVWLYRNNTRVVKLEDYKGTSYNFYPYMTKAGTYTYRVRSVPHTQEQKEYGKNSEWTESDEFYIDEDEVSDGSGQNIGSGNGDSAVSNTTQVGWIQSGNTWYYKYPDGSLKKNGWEKISNVWYLFDATGKMATGWQNSGGETYYLADNGAMYTGWIKAAEKWYYLNRASDGGVEGAMRKGWLQLNGSTYYLDQNGAMIEGWFKVGDDYYYFYPGSGNMAVNTTIDTFRVNERGVWVR